MRLDDKLLSLGVYMPLGPVLDIKKALICYDTKVNEEKMFLGIPLFAIEAVTETDIAILRIMHNVKYNLKWKRLTKKRKEALSAISYRITMVVNDTIMRTLTPDISIGWRRLEPVMLELYKQRGRG